MNIIRKLSVYKNRLFLIVFGIFVISFIVRLVFLNQLQSLPTFEQPIMDEKYHLDLVRQINSPEGLPDEPYFRAPLYPYYLAFISNLTGDSIYRLRFIGIILGSLLPVLILLLGLKIFRQAKSVAYISAAAAVFYPTFLYFDASLLITSMMILLTTLLVLLLYRCQEKPTAISFLTAGALLGLAALARPNILLLGLFLSVWVWLVLKPRIGYRKAILNYLLLGLACLTVIAPITIRNYVISKDFVLISWQGGYNFFIGNNHKSNGWSATVPGIDISWTGGYREQISIAEKSHGRRLKKSEVSDYWFARGVEEILENPGVFAKLIFKKLRLIINGYEIPNNQGIYQIRSFAPITKPLLFNAGIFFPYGLVIPLAFIGFIVSLKNWRRFLVLYLVLFSYALSLLTFFVCARFRQPFLPLLILLAIYGGYYIFRYVKEKNWKRLIFYLIPAVVLLAESNHSLIGYGQNQEEAAKQYILGNARKKINDFQGAIEHYELAIEADSNYIPAIHNMGNTYSKMGDYNKAIDCYRRAITNKPSEYRSYLFLAFTFRTMEEYSMALDVLQTAKKLGPYSEWVFYELAINYYMLGNLEEARGAIEECLRLNPKNEIAAKFHDLILADQNTGN